LVWLFTPGIPGTAAFVHIVMRPLDGSDPIIVVRGGREMNLFKEGQKASAELRITTASGSPAKVDGIPVWTNSDETVGTLTVAPDGMSAVYAANVAGTAQIGVTADADLGAGVRPIMGQGDIQVEPGEAVNVQIVFGTPEAQ